MKVIVGGYIRRVFGRQTYDVIGGWRQLRNEELNNFPLCHILLRRLNHL
jgi:hypothetical protein